MSISSRGWDVNGASDQFTFVSTAVSGDVSLVAKISSLQATNAYSLAGLMIRQSLTAGSRQASLFVTPGKGVVMRARASTGGSTVQMTVGSGVAPVWLRLDRKSSTVTAYRSVDGVAWTLIATIKMPLNSNVRVGLAVASHSASTSVAAAVNAISLNKTAVMTSAPAPLPNAAPSISLTAPAGGSTFVAPATINMAATAADSDGSIARVDFYSGATKVGSDTTSPYTFSWANVATGSYALKAVAVDNLGASTSSGTATVTVNANKPPLVSLTSPLTGATFAAPATITLSANASDADGSIQRVDFYNGSVLLGTDTTSPYSFTWLNVVAGSYSLSAVARDNLGASTVSSWSDITVTSTSTLSKAIFTPAVIPDAVQYYMFEVFAAGANPSVATPIASQNIGIPTLVNGECVADVQATIAALAPGGYIATVSSVSAGEGTLRSAPFSFTR
jgi:regulation of enolase protein 1 (concanavalin A-like superfamily)